MHKIGKYEIVRELGAGAAVAAKFAVEHGFSDVYILKGGLHAWMHAGLPVR